jgi:hypothetical protein
MDRDRFSVVIWLRLLSILALVMLGGACNKSTVKLHPVKGKVLFKDQPADGAQIVFRPANEDPAAKLPTPYATVGADGGFTLRTEPHGEGALPGDYIVMISWYGPDPKNPEQSVNKLPTKYADPTTPLLKVTVKEGINELEPFKLKP